MNWQKPRRPAKQETSSMVQDLTRVLIRWSQLSVQAYKKVSLMHAIKADSGCAGTAPFIPNKGPRWRWVASLASHAYRSTPGKRFHLNPLNRRLGWPQSQYARFCEEEKNLFARAGIRIPDHPARSLRSPGTASCGAQKQQDNVEGQCMEVSMYRVLHSTSWTLWNCPHRAALYNA